MAQKGPHNMFASAWAPRSQDKCVSASVLSNLQRLLLNQALILIFKLYACKQSAFACIAGFVCHTGWHLAAAQLRL